MKPFYTIDAGEFLVASHLEKTFPGISLWFPTKDEGDDLLLLNRAKATFCTVQIKVSRDYLSTHMDSLFHPHLQCCGWFTPNRSKIQNSISDFWIIGLHSYGVTRLSFIIVPPKELLRRYDKIHGLPKRFQSYFWLTAAGKVFETRGLNKQDQIRVAEGTYSDDTRDFTSFLNNWNAIKKQIT